MPLLTDDQYKATMAEGMRRLESVDDPQPDLKSYLAAIPVRDSQDYDFSSRSVDAVYATADGRFLHVLLAATVPNVFLVIVIDSSTRQVHGHHLLNLRVHYGLDEPG